MLIVDGENETATTSNRDEIEREKKKMKSIVNTAEKASLRHIAPVAIKDGCMAGSFGPTLAPTACRCKKDGNYEKILLLMCVLVGGGYQNANFGYNFASSVNKFIMSPCRSVFCCLWSNLI